MYISFGAMTFFLILFALFAGTLMLFRMRNVILRNRIRDALHKKAEITNFLSLFSQNLKSFKGVENSMNMTARYAADLIEAQSICIFAVDGDYLRAVGVSGAFPPLHKSNQYVLTKPRYILESLKKDKIHIGEGLIGEIAAKRENVFMENATDNPYFSSQDTLVPVKTLMAVPLVHEARVTGVMCAVNSRRTDRPFSPEQFGSFKFIASQVVLAQNIVEVYSKLSEQQRINQELEFARDLQASLLPKEFPAWDQFVVHSFTRSSKEVSGDFYDFVRIDEDRLLIVVGDACGKGIPACMIMAMTRSFIRSSIDHFTTLKDLLKELNRNIFRDTDEERFITLACCLLDKKQSTLEYARAGHTELFIFVHGHVRRIFPDGTALGLLPEELSSFDTLCIEFSPEMSILLFTDGISEATNKRGEEYGNDRLMSVFRDSMRNGDDTEGTIQEILDSIDDFTGSGESQDDDQTMVLIQHL
jgi:sigma-B regulation protein RsbU (phosphoserine phosphatase)